MNPTERDSTVREGREQAGPIGSVKNDVLNLSIVEIAEMWRKLPWNTVNQFM